ncbi:neuropeptide Y receptor type 2-like [Oculina patagonica]
MTLSLMAIDRQDCVLRPFHRRITPRNVKTVILVTWFVALVFISVFVFFEAFTSDSVCHNFDPYTLLGKLTTWNSFTTYVIAIAMLLNVATFLIIVITFIRILKKLRSSPISHSNSSQDRREREITKFTYRSCTIFAVCWLPVFTCNLLVRFGGFDDDEMKAAQVLTVTIAKFTYVLNPFLHHKMLKERTVNQIFAMAALNDRRTRRRILAGAENPACSANVRLRDIADVAPTLGSGVEVPRVLPSDLNC